MWTGQRSAGNRERYDPAVESGTVTQNQEVNGVYLDGERRQMAVASLGGYRWQPTIGEKVLVLKENQGDGSQFIVAVCDQGGEDLSAGEVEISSTGTAKLSLKGDKLELSGELWYENQTFEDYLKALIVKINGE